MAESRNPDFLGLLRALLRHEVAFCVVGGVAAQLAGAPILTFDLDILFEKTAGNLSRLLMALHDLEARYRDPAGRHIEPDLARLESMHLHLFLTRLGALDLLSTIGRGQTYRDLLDRTTVYKLGGLDVRVLDLAAVIESKEHADRDKDRAALPVLRQTLALTAGPAGD